MSYIRIWSFAVHMIASWYLLDQGVPFLGVLTTVGVVALVNYVEGGVE